jgi:hypothetical protein
MAITMFEAFPSRDMTLGDKPAIDLAYIIMGTRDDDLVRVFLKANTPTAYSNLLRQSAQVKETAPETWECTVRYGPTKEPEKGDWKWEFDTTGGNQKITQSKENIHNYPMPGKTAPDFKGAIGVTDDSVEGCEIIVPQFKWTETHQLDAKEVTWDYSQKLFDLTGKTNQAAFRGFGVKQVLFYGAKGSQSAKNPDLVEMTFNFAASRDANNLVVGDINAIAKKAWEYLWVRYGLVPENPGSTGGPGKLLKRPTSVHIERVYDSGDFSKLGIGS